MEKVDIFDDRNWLPINFNGEIVGHPVYKGSGNHSIMELETLCKQFEEFCHQQQIIKQSLMSEMKRSTTALIQIRDEVKNWQS